MFLVFSFSFFRFRFHTFSFSSIFWNFRWSFQVFRLKFKNTLEIFGFFGTILWNFEVNIEPFKNWKMIQNCFTFQFSIHRLQFQFFVKNWKISVFSFRFVYFHTVVRIQKSFVFSQNYRVPMLQSNFTKSSIFVSWYFKILYFDTGVLRWLTSLSEY